MCPGDKGPRTTGDRALNKGRVCACGEVEFLFLYCRPWIPCCRLLVPCSRPGKDRLSPCQAWPVERENEKGAKQDLFHGKDGWEDAMKSRRSRRNRRLILLTPSPRLDNLHCVDLSKPMRPASLCRQTGILRCRAIVVVRIS